MVVQIFFDKNNLQNLEFFVTLKLLLLFKDSNNKENVFFNIYFIILRSSHQEVFFEKGVLKICSKSTGEQPCRNVISIKVLQIYWNHTSAWVFSCKFAVYFQNTFF